MEGEEFGCCVAPSPKGEGTEYKREQKVNWEVGRDGKEDGKVVGVVEA